MTSRLRAGGKASSIFRNVLLSNPLALGLHGAERKRLFEMSVGDEECFSKGHRFLPANKV